MFQLAASAAAGLLEVQADRARSGGDMKIKKMQIRHRVCPIEGERFRACRAHLSLARGILPSTGKRRGKRRGEGTERVRRRVRCGNARLIERISGLAGEL